MFQRLILVVGLFLVSACAAEVPPPLTAEQRATYGITEVVVTYPQEAELWWGEGDRAVARGAGIDQTDAEKLAAFMEKPESQRALRDMAADRLQRAIYQQVARSPGGEKPAHLAVRIESAWLSSAAQQVLVGGDHTVWGAVQLFDLETGEALTPPQRMVGFGGGGGGIVGALIDAARPDPMSRAGQSFGHFTRNWIAAREPVQLPIIAEQNTPTPLLAGPEVAPPVEVPPPAEAEAS